MQSYSALFRPGKIGALQLKNRVVMAPMATNFADTNGEVTDVMIDYYRERARGGAGLIIVEAACVDPSVGREGFKQLSAAHPVCITGLQRLTAEIKACGSRAFLQLFHAGRQTFSYLNGGQQVIAPSAIPCPMIKEMPRAINVEEIITLKDKFINAALYAHQAGFDGVELHAAHGYLINQFLSPHSNQRSDEYGGSIGLRMKFLLEILTGIKAALPAFPVSVRLNIDDFIPGGLTQEESLLVCQELELAGADVIHCSCGTYESGLTSIEPSSYPEGWRIYLARAVKGVVNIPVMGGGMVRSPEMANQIVTDGEADFVFLGRSLLADPYWPRKASQGWIEDIRPCIACNNCISNNFKGLAVRCTVNPYVGREKYDRAYIPVQQDLEAVVVGGGPAGMQAALSMRQRGIKVRLYEREDQLGGLMNLAGLLLHRERILAWRDYMVRKIEMAGIDIVLNRSCNLQDLEAVSPDILVVATGSIPFKAELNADQNDTSHEATEVLRQGVEWSGLQIVIIGGGSTGCELAESLALKNNQVMIIEKNSQLARGMEKKNRRDLLNRLEAAGVKRICSREVKGISQDKIIVEDSDGVEEHLIYNQLVWASGFQSANTLYYEALSKFSWVFLVGDAREIRSFREAVLEGETIASLILS